MTSSDRTAYSCLEGDTLIELFKDRGLGDVRKAIVDALVAQDDRHSKHPFPFMSLPAEIRNMIYSYALPQGETLYPPSPDYAHLIVQRPDLTRVNPVVRAESLAVLFNHNTVDVDIADSTLGLNDDPDRDAYYYLFEESAEYLQQLGRHIDLLRKIRTSEFEVLIKNKRRKVILEFERNMTQLPKYTVRIISATRRRGKTNDVAAASYLEAFIQRIVDARTKFFDLDAYNIDAFFDRFARENDYDNMKRRRVEVSGT